MCFKFYEFEVFLYRCNLKIIFWVPFGYAPTINRFFCLEFVRSEGNGRKYLVFFADIISRCPRNNDDYDDTESAILRVIYNSGGIGLTTPHSSRERKKKKKRKPDSPLLRRRNGGEMRFCVVTRGGMTTAAAGPVEWRRRR